MIAKTTYDSARFKAICSGRDCGRKPTKLLKIMHIKKVGNFCETCAADLLKAGLVEEELMSRVDQ
ncbi:MAG: hypothetical protein ACRD5E_03170 [Nitrososphaeraceae archaeon]